MAERKAVASPLGSSSHTCVSGTTLNISSYTYSYIHKLVPIGFLVTTLALTLAFSRSLRQKLKNVTFSQDTRRMNRTRADYEYDHQNIVERLIQTIWRGMKVSIYWLRGSEYPKVLDDSDHGFGNRYQSPRRTTTHHRGGDRYIRTERVYSMEDASFDRIDLQKNTRPNHLRMRQTDTSIRRNADGRPTFLSPLEE